MASQKPKPVQEKICDFGIQGARFQILKIYKSMGIGRPHKARYFLSKMIIPSQTKLTIIISEAQAYEIMHLPRTSSVGLCEQLLAEKLQLFCRSPSPQ